MFTSAALQFGKLDVIGHALIVVVLLDIAGDDAKLEDKSALAKTAPSDNYPSARPPRLILIDAVLTQIVAL